MAFKFQNPWAKGGEHYPTEVLENNVTASINEFNVKHGITIDGPFYKSKPEQKAKAVSRNHGYYYFASFKSLTEKSKSNVKWSISYDDFDHTKSFYLFSGGTIVDGKLRVEINSKNATDKFKIYAYTGDLPNSNTFTEVYFKKSINLFIGGAGDKEEYLGIGPTKIVSKLIEKFNGTLSEDFRKDVQSHYLGYNEAFKSKIDTVIIPLLLKKEICSINIIGHSLGGWNGAHLSKKLADKGYNVQLLVTLDPVGTKVGVTLISDLYWETPIPRKKFWINIKSDSTKFTIDNIIADTGGQWNPPKSQIDINKSVLFTHAQADEMFFESFAPKSLNPKDFLDWHIQYYLQEE